MAHEVLRSAVRPYRLDAWCYRLPVTASCVPGCITFLVVLLALSCHAASAEPFHRLSGTQIKTRFTGHVLTDGTHWRETYAPGGKLLIEEMGHDPVTGSWRVDQDRLCKRRPSMPNECYDVWSEGDRIQLHLNDLPPLDAFLRAGR
jgi:hypothetical protein